MANLELAEQTIVSRLLTDESLRSKYIPRLEATDFYSPGVSDLFYAIASAHLRGLSLDVATLNMLAHECNASSPVSPEIIESFRTYGRTSAGEMNESALRAAIESVKRNALKTELSTYLTPKISQYVADDSTGEDALLAELEIVKSKIINSDLNAEDMYQTLGSILAGDWAAELERRRKGLSFIPTGFSHLDYFLTEAFAPGRVTIVGARPGCGKSAFVDNVAVRISNMSEFINMGSDNTLFGVNVGHSMLTEPVHVAICSLEMQKVPLSDRIVSIGTQVDLHDIIRNPSGWTEYQTGKINTFCRGKQRNSYIHIDDTPSQTLDQAAKRIEGLKRKLGVNSMVVIFDLFGRLADMDDTRDSTAAHAKALKKAQMLAKTLNCHFVLVAQIGRSIETGKKDPKTKKYNYRPRMSSLKQTGAFEEVADNIFFLYRQKYYDPKEDVDLLELEIAKQRQGRMGKVINLFFKAQTTTLYTTDVFSQDQVLLGLDIVKPEDFHDRDMYYEELPKVAASASPMDIFASGGMKIS